FTFPFSLYDHIRALHSFPTRRSSDLTGWMYWTSNIVYFPGLLFYAASNSAYVIPRYAYLKDSKSYIVVFSLIGLLVALTQADERSEEHTSELQSQSNLVCRLLLEKKK